MLRKSLFALAALATLAFGSANSAVAGGWCGHGGYGHHGGGGYHASYYGGSSYYGGGYGGGYGYGYGGPVVVRRAYYPAPVYAAPYPSYPRYGGRGGVSVSFGF